MKGALKIVAWYSVLGLTALAMGAMFFLRPTWTMLLRHKAPPSPITAAWSNRKAAEWNDGTRAPETGCLLNSVSYGRIGDHAFTPKVTEAELAMLVQAGCTVIRIDLNYDPWLDNSAWEIAKYDNAAVMVRAQGLKLMIADAAGESYRNKRKTGWDDFKTAWVSRISAVAARYRPDYYVVVKEPGWYWMMPARALLSQPWARTQDWIDLTHWLVDAVKKASPKTKTAIAVPGDSLYGGRTSDMLLAWYRAALAMPNLDILGFDNYNARSFGDAQRFMREAGPAKKEFWLLEAWSHAKPNETAAESDADSAFVTAALRFGGKFHLGGVVFFFTRYLASYDRLPDTERGLLRFYAGRTLAFDALRRATP